MFELLDEVAAAPVGLVFAGEVVGSELDVGGVLGEQVPIDDQDCVRDRDQCSLLAAAFRDPPEPHREVAVLGAHSGVANDNDGVGFNPFRQQRQRRSDYVLVVAAFVVVALLVLWAAFPR